MGWALLVLPTSRVGIKVESYPILPLSPTFLTVMNGLAGERKITGGPSYISNLSANPSNLLDYGIIRLVLPYEIFDPDDDTLRFFEYLPKASSRNLPRFSGFLPKASSSLVGSNDLLSLFECLLDNQVVQFGWKGTDGPSLNSPRSSGFLPKAHSSLEGNDTENSPRSSGFLPKANSSLEGNDTECLCYLVGYLPKAGSSLEGSNAEYLSIEVEFESRTLWSILKNSKKLDDQEGFLFWVMFALCSGRPDGTTRLSNLRRE